MRGMSMRFGRILGAETWQAQIQRVGQNNLTWSNRLVTGGPSIHQARHLGLTGFRFPFEGQENLIHGGRVLGDMASVFELQSYG